MSLSMPLRWLLLAVLLSSQLLGQDLKWTSLPAAYSSGTAYDSEHNKLFGELPLSIKWKDASSGEWLVTIRGIGEPDTHGVSTVAKLSVISPSGVKAELITPATDHWLPIYGYMNLGNAHSNLASIAKTTIGDWDIWEITIEPVTNGDPPNYRLWVVRNRASNQASIQGAVGRGIIAYTATNRRLDFIFLTQKGQESSKEGRHFQFQVGQKFLRRKEIRSCDVVWSIDAPHPIIIEREVIPGALNCLTWKVNHSDATEGVATPDGVLQPTTWKWVSDIPGYVDKYSKYDLPDPLPYAAIKPDSINFKWASELHEYPSSTGPWENGKPIGLDKVRELLNTDRYRILLQRVNGKDFIAFGICKN